MPLVGHAEDIDGFTGFEGPAESRALNERGRVCESIQQGAPCPRLGRGSVRLPGEGVTGGAGGEQVSTRQPGGQDSCDPQGCLSGATLLCVEKRKRKEAAWLRIGIAGILGLVLVVCPLCFTRRGKQWVAHVVKVQSPTLAARGRMGKVMIMGIFF